MAKSNLTKALEKILYYWGDYIPPCGVSQFVEDMKEVIELSKKYKR